MEVGIFISVNIVANHTINVILMALLKMVPIMLKNLYFTDSFSADRLNNPIHFLI